MSLLVEVMVCGYHIYEDIWDAIVAATLCSCSSTLSNLCLDIGRQLDIAAPFPFANRLSSTLFTPALAKTMEDDDVS